MEGNEGENRLISLLLAGKLLDDHVLVMELEEKFGKAGTVVGVGLYLQKSTFFFILLNDLTHILIVVYVVSEVLHRKNFLNCPIVLR